MNKSAPPSAGSPRWWCSRCRASACCCSCGWPSAAPVPLKPKGYRVNVVVRRGDAARHRGRRADLRRAGRQGQDDRAGQRRRAARTSTIELESRYAPLPSDARAILRQKTLLGETYVELTPGTATRRRCPRTARWPRRRSPTPCSSTRSCARSTRRRAPRSRPGCRSRRRAIGGYGRDLNDALGNLGPFAEDAAHAASTSSTARRARSRSLVSNTGVVFDALSERDGQLRSLIENANRVFAGDRRARRGAQGGVRGAADVRARVRR